jgi:hypothetical protein
LAKEEGVSGVFVWCFIGADVAEFEFGDDGVEYHGAVDYGILVGGQAFMSYGLSVLLRFTYTRVWW